MPIIYNHKNPKTIHLPCSFEIDHVCAGCEHHRAEVKKYRSATWKEILKDAFTRNQPVRWDYATVIHRNWCRKFEKEVEPDTPNLPCFEYIHSEEFWFPYIRVYVDEFGVLQVECH